MFTDVLKKLMKENGVTQKQLSEAVRIGKNQIKYWQDNGNTPNGETLQRIADYFGVTVDYLLGKEDTPSRDDVTFTPKEAELVRRMQDLDDDQAQQLLEYMEFLIQQRKNKREHRN